MHLWLGTTHPCGPPNCNYDGLWVNLHFFMMCIYKHCFPPMLFVFAMECCTKNKCLALCLITIIAVLALLPSPIYACLTCSSVHASSLHSLLAHHHLCYVDVYCVFLFFLFLLYATTFLSDSIFMACSCLCTYFLFRFSF